MKFAAVTMIIVISLILDITPVFALPDQYPGDTSIYGVSSALQPNVLIALDNSGSMGDTITGVSYDPSNTYDATIKCKNTTTGSNVSCVPDTVYIVSSSSDATGNSRLVTATASVTCAAALSGLQTVGWWTGKLTSAYACTTSGSITTKTYARGNYINYLNSPDEGPQIAKSIVAVKVIKNLIANTPNIRFGLMTFHKSTAKQANGTTSVTGGGALNRITTSPASSTTPYITEVTNMDTPFPLTTSTTTNRDALIAALEVVDFSGGVGTIDGQLLLEAGRYFGNCDASGANCSTNADGKSIGRPAWGSTIGVSGGYYNTPIEESCQKNYVILITDGMTTDDGSGTAVYPAGSSTSLMGTICPTSSCAPDGCKSSTCPDFPTGNHNQGINNSSAKVAQFLYNSPQNIVTYTIGFGLGGADADAIAMLKIAADSTHGRGKDYTAGSEAGLSKALIQTLSDIYEQDSAFVAPVVPVSPQNRTYGANRVYIGFFKPQTGLPWQGNLKKYKLDTAVNILDKDGVYATYVDEIDPLSDQDDRDSVTVPTGKLSGSFRSGAKSFWNDVADGGDVDNGGVGLKLASLSNVSSRTIYTMTSASSSSLVSFDSSNVSPDMLGYGSTDTVSRDNLLDFIYGEDVFDEDADSGTTIRSWIFGDVLHSKPLVLNYNSYPEANEGNCTGTNPNTSMIYVGSNDGMLHAFKDCDGSEAWAFIPPDMLGNLKNIPTSGHPYFVDSSVASYVYNHAKDGNINTANGDKVIIVFGERRGGGTLAAPTTGAYYALDVSNPSSPSVLWTMSNSYPAVSGTPTFPELAETWSEPKIVKMKIGTADKIVAFFGAGYDNPNEDGRYGATQNFQGIGTGVAAAATGSGSETSPSGTGTAPYNISPKGRGIYAVEIATMNSGTGKPDVATSQTKVWGFTYGSTATSSATGKTDPGVVYSFPAQLVAIDSNNSGYTDRIYGLDTGGNLWRFNVGDTDRANWTGTKIFSANPGVNSSGTITSTVVGRKVFYPPAVVSQYGYKMIFFGTGDREHPLNKNVVDRFYAVKDTGTTSGLTESNLIDVTTDLVQGQDTSDAAGRTALSNLLTSLTTSNGWFIRLDQNDGEKILAPPTVFNKVAYFTTYYPSAAVSASACSYDLGTAQLYAVNYLNGAAVFNYYTGNDTNTTTNKYARDSNGNILLRADRNLSLGTGIPSGVVVVIDPGGNTEGLVSAGGTIQKKDVITGGTIIPLYWRQK